MIDQLGHLGIGVDQALCEFFRMAGDEADAFDAVEFCNVFDQQRKVRDFAVGHGAAICIHILAQQRDFLHALRGQAGDFC